MKMYVIDFIVFSHGFWWVEFTNEEKSDQFGLLGDIWGLITPLIVGKNGQFRVQLKCQTHMIFW